jgi:hypothetical protein
VSATTATIVVSGQLAEGRNVTDLRDHAAGAASVLVPGVVWEGEATSASASTTSSQATLTARVTISNETLTGDYAGQVADSAFVRSYVLGAAWSWLLAEDGALFFPESVTFLRLV